MQKLKFKIPIRTKGGVTELNANGITGLIPSINFQKVIGHLFSQKEEIQSKKKLNPYIQYVGTEKYRSFVNEIKNKQKPISDTINEINIFDGRNLIIKIKCLEEDQEPSK